MNVSTANYVISALDKSSTRMISWAKDNESIDHLKIDDLFGKEPAMAHAMTAAMTVMMILMMTIMAGMSLAFGARKVLPLARRALNGSRGATAGPGQRSDG